ncbi:AsnC family transcriptional regulator [Sphingobium lactosutens]|uniref:RrF2 family transcriptional regulator n=1 Tax=Sphingobium lactosutens TaxID=522773 RepID=UPI0015B9F5BA|nr:Rrf2 family transcriptional regulator [Sphingobium lactosutens]NWK96726.1 AsnC family transcriptional regulator [Sphingobium lactosutens]
MKLSSFADYAVVLMSAAARHCGHAALDAAGNQRFTRMNATTLSAETGIPLPTAQKLVSRLSAAGLLESSRGTGGGVRLSRPPAAITLADVVEAVEGPIAMTACSEQGAHDCNLESDCRIRPHMNVANNAIREALAGVTIASLTREMA